MRDMSRVLNRLGKITSRNPDLHSKWVDLVYPNQANSLHKDGLAPSISLIMGGFWGKKDEIMDCGKDNAPDTYKKKNRNVKF